jgi:hypothetical protein
MSPQLSARRPAFPTEKPDCRAIAGSIRRAARVLRRKGLMSAWIFRDCHGDLSVKMELWPPFSGWLFTTQ